MQRRETPNSLPLHLFSKLKSKIIYKQMSNMTWHIHISMLKMLSLINYLSEHTGFNTDSFLKRFTFISFFIIPL